MNASNDEPCDGFAPEGRRPSPDVLAHLNPPVVFLGGAPEPADPVVAALARALAERDKLRAFKDYVHARLDAAGVSADPDSPHKAEGCRVGGRLDELIGGRDALRVAAAEALGFVRYALEFFDWARFPALESSIEKLRDDLARVVGAKGAGPWDSR